jgi:lysophospholipase L1-like esterase
MMIRPARLVRDVCLVIALLAAAGCGGGSSNSTGSSNSSSQTPSDFDFGGNSPLKVTAFGDSITQGVLELKRRDLRLSTSSNYPALLQGKLRGLDPRWVVVNRGNSGEQTAAGARRIGGVLRVDQPGFVLIMEGTNDAQACESAAGAAANLRSMVQTAKANKSIPIIGTVPPNFRDNPCANEVIFQINNQIHGFAAAEGVSVAEIFNGMNDRSLFGLSPDRDPLHPNERGYAVMADIWFQSMLQVMPGGPAMALRRRR